jgi:hypothetical protein
LEAFQESNSCLLSGGAPDSPVHHRTFTVQCPVQIAFLNLRSRPLKTWSRWRTGQSGAPIKPLARPRVTRGLRGRPLAHRTVRCTTGQSGAPPDSLVNFSRTPLSAFRDRGVPGPTSEMSPRAPAQMGRRETEREGGKRLPERERERWKSRGLRVCPVPRSGALAVGGYKRPRGRGASGLT